MNVQTFKTVYKSIFDAMDKADRRIGYVDHGMSPNADASNTLVVSVSPGEYVKNSETSLTSYAGGTIALTAGNVSNPRVDIVYMSSLGALAQASGTPASVNPVPASWPAGAAPIALAYIPAAATDFSGTGYLSEVAQYKRFLEGGTPSLAWASVAAPGSAQRFVRVDDQIKMFDSVDPASVLLGGASNPGTTSFAARSNHGHEQKFIGVHLTNTVSVQVASGAGWVPVSFNTVRTNTDGMYSSASATKITFPTTGRYMIGAQLYQASVNASGGWARIRVNGGTVFAGEDHRPAIASVATNNFTTQHDVLVSTDYVELEVLQQASTITIDKSSNTTPEFWAYRIG